MGRQRHELEGQAEQAERHRRLQTELVGLLCVPDPVLGKVETPFGSVLFLQLFGLTEDELERVQTWTLERKVGLAYDASPFAITDPARI